jgi:hypothetical protein
MLLGVSSKLIGIALAEVMTTEILSDPVQRSNCLVSFSINFFFLQAGNFGPRLIELILEVRDLDCVKVLHVLEVLVQSEILVHHFLEQFLVLGNHLVLLRVQGTHALRLCTTTRVDR